MLKIAFSWKLEEHSWRRYGLKGYHVVEICTCSPPAHIGMCIEADASKYKRQWEYKSVIKAKASLDRHLLSQGFYLC